MIIRKYESGSKYSSYKFIEVVLNERTHEMNIKAFGADLVFVIDQFDLDTFKDCDAKGQGAQYIIDWMSNNDLIIHDETEGYLPPQGHQEVQAERRWAAQHIRSYSNRE